MPEPPLQLTNQSLATFSFPFSLPPHSAILSSFATVLQLLHWILFVASRYNLLYALSWCGLTIFAVFVCFRYRSITLLSSSGGGGGGDGSRISKVLRHRHQRNHPYPPTTTSNHHRGEQLPSSEELVPSPPWENGYNQLHAASSGSTHDGSSSQWQQQQHSQKHSPLSPVAEEWDQDDAATGGNTHVV